MNIYVLSKKDFTQQLSSKNINDKTVDNFTGTIFISINNSDSDDTYFKEEHSNVINLLFDDVVHDYEIADIIKHDNIVGHVVRKLKSFSEYDANKIWNFIKNNKDKETLIVHCSAGISRSGAVGLFVNDLLKQNYYKFMEMNSNVKPNQLVLELLRKVSL